VLEVTDDDHGQMAAGRFRLAADGDTVDCLPTHDLGPRSYRQVA